jgi:asparagine synthase (glutamine-hydrolysing)
MCGIAGVLGSTESAGPLIAALAHRGPNGIRIEDGPGWSVGHARLSIIDLEGGWQPLHAAGSTVIGNGEIYNYLELIEEFGLQDKLTTGSDFEPLLHLYAMEGEKAFKRLRGMYAFCLMGGDGRTWLVRDGFGIKPLYYRQNGEAIAFASEPRAFGAANARDRGLLDIQLLSLNYTIGAATARDNVLRVPPGAVWRIDTADSPPPLPQPPAALLRGNTTAVASEADALKKLDSVLEDSVRVHQRSDVPYGLFLSGGIDSTAIATLMSRINEKPVVAFTCGFDAPGAADERRQAERVARALNLDWRETTFGEQDFWEIAPQVAWALDDPTTDYACLPTFKLAQAAKGSLTVVLSGEGGDELFGGYGRYRRALRPAWLGGRPAWPQVDAPFLKPVPSNAWLHAFPQLKSVQPEAREAMLEWLEMPSDTGVPTGLTRLQQAQYADIVTWLPNDLLLKLDRCLMANGLEGRTPFLDREVAAFAFNLPDRLKVRGRYGKWLLRKWLEGACPAADPWAKKQGFTVPVADWIAPRAADLGPRIAAVEAVRQVCDVEAVRAVFGDGGHAKSRWPLLFFALWSLIHLQGAEPADALSSLLGN